MVAAALLLSNLTAMLASADAEGLGDQPWINPKTTDWPLAVVADGCAGCAVDPLTGRNTPLTVIYRILDSSQSSTWAVDLQWYTRWSTTRNTSIVLRRLNSDRIRPVWPQLLSSGVCDIGFWSSVDSLADYAYDLSAIAAADGWNERFSPRIRQMMTRNGKVIGLADKYDFWGIWYKKSLFVQLGVTQTPETWDEFVALCGVIKRYGITPLGFGIQDDWQPETWWEHVLLRVGGNTWWNNFVAGGVDPGTDPVFATGVSLLTDLLDRGFFPNFSDPAVAQLSFVALIESWAFQTIADASAAVTTPPQIAMILMTSAVGSFVEELGLDNDDYDWFAFPQIAVANLTFANSTSGNATTSTTTSATVTLATSPQERGEFTEQSVWVVNRNAQQLPMALDWIRWVAQDNYSLAILAGAVGYASPQIAVRRVVSSASMARGFDMQDASGEVHVFIDNSIPAFSAFTRPIGVQFFLRAIAQAAFLAQFATARTEILLSTVSAPIIQENTAAAASAASASDVTVVLSCATVNASLWYALIVGVSTTAATATAAATADDSFIAYRYPIVLSAGGPYRLRVFARNPPMLDSVEIEKSYPAIAGTDRDYAGDTGARTAIVALASVLATGTAATTGVIVVWRDKKVVRAASPVFCVTLLVGGGLMYVAVIATIPYAPTASGCLARLWLGHLAFGIALAALLAKTWRVVRIFERHQRLAVMRITDLELMTYVGVYSAVVAAYLATWTAIDPPTPTAVAVSDTNYVVCASRSGAWAWAPLIAEATLLTCACVLAYRARDHPQAFNESGWIALAVYNVVVVGGIVVTLLFSGLVDRPDSASFLVGMGLLFGNTALLLLLFVPKFLLIFRYGDNLDVLRSSANTMEMHAAAGGGGGGAPVINTVVRVRAGVAAQKYNTTTTKVIVETGSDLGHEKAPPLPGVVASSSPKEGAPVIG